MASLQALLQQKLMEATLRPTSLIAGPASTGTAFVRMDAYRQTFHALVNALTTYKPAMLEVKRAYNAMLDRATDSVQLHNQLQRKLAQAQRPALAQHAGGTSTCMPSDVKQVCTEDQQQLLVASAAASQAEAQARAAEAAVSDASGRLRSMQRQVQDLKQDIARMRSGMLTASSWHRPAPRKSLGT